MAQKDKYIPHRRNSLEDLLWLKLQEPCVKELWLDCVTAEGFGDSFREIHTNLSEKSFRKAKKVLEDVLFEFEAVTGLTDTGRSKILGWKVRNIHGWKNEEYWFDSTHEPTMYPNTKRKKVTNEDDFVPSAREILPDESRKSLDSSSCGSSPKTNSNTKTNLPTKVSVELENCCVSSSDDSLRSTHMVGCEEEKSSVLTKDLEVLQDPLSTDQDLGSRSNTNSSSTKTTPNTEPSCSSSEKKRFVSTSDDGSVELIRLRSPHVKPCQHTSPSHDDALQAASASVNAQSHRNPIQSPLKAQLGGSQLESAIEELRESLQAVADDLEMTVEGGIDELCRRFAGLATETEVELLPVPREYPYYDRMNEWVLYENKSIVCFVQRGSETRRLTIGCFR